MQNRLANYAQAVISGIFKDFRYLWRGQREWDRDHSRLLSQLRSRSISLMTLDLPTVEKHLNQCLAEGTYTISGLVLTSPRKGEKIPKFLREIFLRIFSPDGELVERPCPDSIFMLKTLFSLFKKIELACEDRYIDEEIRNFKYTDSNLPSPSLDWDLDDLGVREGERLSVELTPHSFGCADVDDLRGRQLLSYAQRCFDIVASSVGTAPSLRWESTDYRYKPKHGPGAVSNLSSGSSKYRFPYWSKKLQARFPFDFYAVPSFGHGFSSDGTFDFSEVEIPAKLIAVPKDIRKPRLIASEPVENQWIQQLIAGVLIQEFNSPLFCGSITLKDQTGNQKAALKGSIDGLISTIDLSEASDRLSLKLLEFVFRTNSSWLKDLHSSRSKAITLKDGEILTLKKFAPQGNACTFPVQTLVFYALAQAAVCFTASLRPSRRTLIDNSRTIRVYGDDITIPTCAVDALVELFHLVGLKVNKSKTFYKGNFRESCGVDAFMGYDVTPARLRGIPRGLASVPSIIETSNSFYKKGLWYSSDAILQFTKKWDHLIPVRCKPDVPICKISFLGDKSQSRRKWNPNLHAYDERMLIIETKKRKIQMEARERIMQYFTENPDPESRWESGVTSQGLQITLKPGWVNLS